MSSRLGVRIKFQDYRHIAKAINRKYMRSAPEDESEGAGAADELYNLAAGHLLYIIDYIYTINAVILRSLSARSLSSFRIISER